MNVTQAHFLPLIYFYTSIKNQKTTGFLFSRGVESEEWHETSSLSINNEPESLHCYQLLFPPIFAVCQITWATTKALSMNEIFETNGRRNGVMSRTLPSAEPPAPSALLMHFWVMLHQTVTQWFAKTIPTDQHFWCSRYVGWYLQMPTEVYNHYMKKREMFWSIKLSWRKTIRIPNHASQTSQPCLLKRQIFFI